MNKKELVEDVALMAGVSRADTVRVVNAMSKAIRNQVANGDNVTLTGLGSFGMTKRSARNGRNPATGKAIVIAARNAPKFTPAKAFKDALNK